MTFNCTPLSRCLLLLILAVATVRAASTSQSTRVSQRLVGGHTKTPPNGDVDDKQDEKKTLSQQVAEGKYGLIQTELFKRRPERPGVLSYERNSEVPRDDENSLGGLAAEEIWLAEDHLLVLKGGAFHRTASEMPWPPIDDYVAPGRQVKIPARPQVPPPFPVQLAEGGPLQYLGVDAAAGEIASAGTPPGDGTATPHPPPRQDPANATPGRAPFQVPPFSGYARPENYPGGDGPAPFPFPPPRLNQSIDYDDPSIYYPPPYSFYYQSDNSTDVPPGPLVPGIVLPPPPDFFGPLEDTRNITASSKQTTTPAPATTAPPTNTPPPPSVIVITQAHRRPTIKKPIRYLPYDDNYIHSTTPQAPASVTTESYANDLQEQETPTVLVPTTPAPKTHTGSSVPVVHIPYPNLQQRPQSTTDTPPTSAPLAPNVPVLAVPYKQHAPPKIVSIISISPKHPSTTNRYGTPTLASVPVLRTPYNDQRTYLTPTPTPQLEEHIQVYKQQPPPRTYLHPTVRPTGRPQISVTIESVPYRERPIKQQLTGTVGPIVHLQYEEPRTYLKPTVRPQIVHTVAPVAVHYVTYDERNQKPRTRLKPTTKPQLVNTVPTIVRLPYVQRTRTQVSSSAVPLKNYFSSADVETNSVQPQSQVDYYFYEEDATEPPRQRYVQPTNFDRHVQQLRQKIQSYLKPTSKPVYEYSFQAANYQPTSPTPAPYQAQYVTTNRYQEAPPNRGYYTPKQDERVLDDITKKYFTTFGQKLTTPVTPVKSLAQDTIVNYREPRPSGNPEAEFIDEKSLYKKQPGTYISYQLPGEGAHFYFLTPQLVKQQRNLGLEQQAIAQRQYEQQRLEQERFEQQQQHYDQQRLEQQRVEEGRYRQPVNPEIGYYYPKPNNQKRRNER